MEKLIPPFACLLIGAAMLMEIEPETTEMCNKQQFVDGPIYMDGTAVCSYYGSPYDNLYCTNMRDSSLSQFQRTYPQLHVRCLNIYDSSFTELNSHSFGNISFDILTFIHTKIENFQLFSGPNALQERLMFLYLSKCEFYNSDFTYLPTFSVLSKIKIIDPVNATTDFNVTNYLPNSTEYVELTKCGISSIGQMSSLSRLSQLYLDRNNLPTIKRSSFPRPAYKLFSINLSGNPIRSLPEDAFTEMPRLNWIMLQNTLLTTLPSNVFQPVLIGRTPRLALCLRIHGIPLHCDNEIAWMKNQTEVLELDQNVICKSPDALAGMKLKDVDLS